MLDDKFEISYSALWRSIIRPPRDEYSEEFLGDSLFTFRESNYVRKDYNLLSKLGHTLKASFIEPEDDSRVK